MAKIKISVSNSPTSSANNQDGHPIPILIPITTISHSPIGNNPNNSNQPPIGIIKSTKEYLTFPKIQISSRTPTQPGIMPTLITILKATKSIRTFPITKTSESTI